MLIPWMTSTGEGGEYMETLKSLTEQVAAATGSKKAELVLKMHVSSMYLPSQWKKGILPLKKGVLWGLESMMG